MGAALLKGQRDSSNPRLGNQRRGALLCNDMEGDKLPRDSSNPRLVNQRRGALLCNDMEGDICCHIMFE
jgi:hypothetical protein